MPNVFVIETASNTIVTIIPIPNPGRGIAITPDGAFAYVPTGLFLSGPVLVIATATNTVVATVNLPVTVGITVPMAITPDGAFLYVGTNTNIAVIETATNTVVATLNVRTSSMAITPDGAFLYAPLGIFPTSRVLVIETATNTVVATVNIAAKFAGKDVAITPDGAFAYVLGPLKRVSVIETATNTLVATFNLAHNVSRVAITPLAADSDGDGVNDDDDLCPDTATGATVDANGCSDAQVDGDGDGVCDPGAPSDGPSACTGVDNCPVVTNPGQEDFDGDGLGDA